MTRKQFAELAEQLRITRKESVRTPEERAIWHECCKAVALACKATSANFDHQHFMNACEED